MPESAPTPQEMEEVKALALKATPNSSLVVRTTFVLGLIEENERLRRERQCLAEAIGNAAIRAGIVLPDTPLTGPQLMLLADNLADAACEYRGAQ